MSTENMPMPKGADFTKKELIEARVVSELQKCKATTTFMKNRVEHPDFGVVGSSLFLSRSWRIAVSNLKRILGAPR